jgi:hypothetical protein
MFSICLAHFCDKHGPRSLLCTQSIPGGNFDDFIAADFSKESYCKSCLLLLPKRLSEEKVTTIKTSDDTQSRHYITSQYSTVKYRVLNSIVRKILSEESTVYDSRPMYFGEGARGYSLTQSFKIRDLEARGSERRFSFIVNCDEEEKIIENWDLITGKITLMINYLKESRNRIEIESSSNNDIFLRGKNQQPRSLAELLQDDELFVKIHLWNAKLLRELNEV